MCHKKEPPCNDDGPDYIKTGFYEKTLGLLSPMAVLLLFHEDNTVYNSSCPTDPPNNKKGDDKVAPLVVFTTE